MGLYQLLPSLQGDEFAALAADIEEHGIRVPIDVDEEGHVLDGHHRQLIAESLGIECPRRVLSGLSENEKRAHAIAVNVHRRSLTREQRRELIANSLKADPELSDRQHADRTGASPTTVGSVRSDLEESGDVSKLDTRTDSAGRKQPAKPARHACQVCGATFTRPVWHCDRCDQHWDDGQVCETCADDTVSIDRPTGEVIDPAPEPTTDEVLDDYLAGNSSVQAAKYRQAALKVLSDMRKATQFDPERLAVVLDEGDWTLWLGSQRDINAWFDRLTKARPSGLRVVNGGQQ